MRRIKVGDTVRAFLNPNIHGKVIEVLYEPSPHGMLVMEGVPTNTTYLVVQVPNGTKYKLQYTDCYIDQ